MQDRRRRQRRHRVPRHRHGELGAGLLGRPSCRATARSGSRPRPCSTTAAPSRPAAPRATRSGPFYCPLDKQVYIDASFFKILEDQFGSSGGPLAQEYVVAHEYGHALQDQLGLLDRAQQDPQGANSGAVRTELMADCLGGVWAKHATTVNDQDTGTPFLKPLTDQDIKDALSAASAVGDDRIQEATQGRVNPESWTHGSAEARQRWFLRASRPATSTSATPSRRPPSSDAPHVVTGGRRRGRPGHRRAAGRDRAGRRPRPSPTSLGWEHPGSGWSVATPPTRRSRSRPPASRRRPPRYRVGEQRGGVRRRRPHHRVRRPRARARHDEPRAGPRRLPHRREPLPRPRPPGAIVNVSSHQAQRPVRGALPYATAKAASRGSPAPWPSTTARDGIRTNAVALGSIATDRFEAYRDAHPEVDDQMAALHPLGRVGTAARGRRGRRVPALPRGRVRQRRGAARRRRPRR